MVVAIAPWSIVLTPGNAQVIVPQGDLQIKNAALPDELQDKAARTSIKLTYQGLAALDDEDEDEDDEDEPPAGKAVTTVLCSLTPGKIEQSTCEIILEQDMEYILEAVGKNTIHLYGNYIDQVPVDQSPLDDDSDSEDDEEAYNLDEVSSDVQVEVDGDEGGLDDEDDDAARFEEVHDEEESPKTLKRTREDAMEVDEHEPEEKLSKSQKKKLAKKLKAADGNAVPAPVPEKVDEPKVDEPKVEEKKDKKDKAQKKKEKSEQKDTQQKEKPQQKDGDQKEKKEKGDKKERTLEGGVKVRDYKPGSGKTAKKGDKVEMRYIGKLVDGRVFDKNTRGKPFVFTLGQGDVIKGWDVGVAGMQVGGEREIVVPPSMGYGNKKMSDIPPNSTLKFEVKLLETR